MKRFLAVAGREIAERRFVFGAAAVASVIPFAIPLVRHMTGPVAREARGFTALLFAVLLAVALALVLGGSVLAGDLANRRLGFYFSRPISGFSLWAGKIAGAMILVCAAASIVLLPVLVFDSGIEPLRRIEGGATGAALVFAAALLLLLQASNGAGLIVRSRSALAFGDFLGLAALALVCWFFGARLQAVSWEPAALVRTFVAGGALVLLIALLAGSYRAVASGRTDLRAAHRKFAATAGAILGLAAAGFSLWTQWAISAPPTSLETFPGWFSSLGSDGWVTVAGRARGTRVGFLYDTRTGGFRRIRASLVAAGASSDGKIAAWLEGESGREGPWRVKTARLTDFRGEPGDPKIPVRYPSALFLSADGARLGVIDGGTLSVHELPSGRSLVSARICPVSCEGAAAVFVTPSTVRVYRRDPEDQDAALAILEVDVANRKWARVANGPSTWRWWGNAAGDRLVALENGGKLVTLRDGRSAAVLAELYRGAPLDHVTARFLPEGRIALAAQGASGSWLSAFSDEGTGKGRFPLPLSGPFEIGGEISPGRLAIAGRTEGRDRTELDIVDLERGTAARAAGGLVPVAGGSRWLSTAPPAGSEASKLFLDEAGALVRFEPVTGERRVLLAGR
ncbi:MAG: hypothetical protein M3S32_07120 [Acidobacteriota bacterium]|nr:hypothetical protein [Acidobacteriota bacterium]